MSSKNENAVVKTVSIIVTREDGKLLALFRAPNKNWFPSKWDIVSGKIETGETAEQCLARELFEETGIRQYKIINALEPIICEFEGQQWLDHLFHCQISQDTKININHEHTDYAWLLAKELLGRDHSPTLDNELEYFFKRGKS